MIVDKLSNVLWVVGFVAFLGIPLVLLGAALLR